MQNKKGRQPKQPTHSMSLYFGNRREDKQLKINETEYPLWSQLEQCGNETEYVYKKLKIIFSEIASKLESSVTQKEHLYWLIDIARDYIDTAETLAKQTQELVAPVIELERNSKNTVIQGEGK